MIELVKEVSLQISKIHDRIKEIESAFISKKEDIVGTESKKLEQKWLKGKLSVLEPILDKVEETNKELLIAFILKEQESRTSLYREVKEEQKIWEDFCDAFAKNEVEEDELQNKSLFLTALHQKEAQLNAYQQIIPIINKYIS